MPIKPKKFKSLSQKDLCLGTTTIGERGQIVIPADARKVLKLKSGDKLVSFVHHGQALTFIKTGAIDGFLHHLTAELKYFKSK